MRIANTVSDSIVDGPSLRFTVFTQGCPHHCPGCHNPDTHDPAGGREVTVAELGAQMVKNPLTDGLTLSGGEPFCQAADCAALARIAREKGLNVWTYTGYTYERLLEGDLPGALELLDQTDVLVDGPFLLAEKSYEALFRGSANQRLIDVKQSRAAGHAVLWTRPDPLAHFVRPES
ncbi:anaerobic ribonucleoside-triphosphate reductase activating protein [Intestinimonas massiliensis (ex Afouda et al. 2020)]|uniref:anaerobic ribonucleoside-triphosphate reductase activating protein n=1 Tax=Intestinimonas massiliensis (ex Afouda et al. 2020) TaxID=1673721 RepID=UPI001030B21E|nr:anaerobic ribonucleoside-triphosphate reductase activating protein [Intestinimonas massiliensis (ex Afouda et al. 2020)]